MCGDRRKKRSVSICAGLVLVLSWLALTGIGCRTQGEGPINSIRLFTSPVLFNLDGEPGPDAFKARVYAVRDSVPKPVPFTKGTLEIIIIDEALNRDQQNPPRQVWSFSGLVLNRHRIQTSIGYSYDFTLEIDKSKPLPAKVSVGAMYTPPSGSPVFAKRVRITVEP